MAHPLLDGCLSKIERARAHVEELRASIEAFRSGDHYHVIRREDRQGSHIQWTWDVSLDEPFPADWPITLGEALYQLHSALDHLAWQLAFLKSSPVEPDTITFPIFQGRQRFWKRGQQELFRQSSGGWALARLPGDARLHVLGVQPYKRGNGAPRHPLALLSALSNHDKHRALHIAAAAATRQRLQMPQVVDLKLGTLVLQDARPFSDHATGVMTLGAEII